MCHDDHTETYRLKAPGEVESQSGSFRTIY